MKIHALRGENTMRMKIFDLTFDKKGGLVIVTGKNGEGKTSLINSFVLALGGSKTEIAKLTQKPIREGADKAWVEVDVGDYTVRRSWYSNDRDSLTVTGKKGEKFGSPQKMLDAIIGDLSFDPLAFTRMKAKEQRELLLTLVDVPLNLEEHDVKRKGIFEKRTEIGRERDRLSGAISSLPEVPDDTPDEEVSVAKLIEEVRSLEAINQQYGHEEMKHQNVLHEISTLEERLQVLYAQRDNLEDWLEKNKRIDTSDLERQIGSAEEINAAVRLRNQYRELNDAFNEQEKKYQAGTEFLARMDQARADALAKAEMPIEGLAFDEDGVLFKGIPFSQLSTSQQIKVSTAIGMAQNPELRVMIIKDGSLLDADNLAAVESLGKTNDFQIFIECVDDSGEIGIVIEDGEVVHDARKKK
jgi:DNA repair exonuclease SbcCD ATPase subunit